MKTIKITLFIFLIHFSQAQVKIGDNHETLNASSLLELESTNKGVLMPRVALTNTSSCAPLASHVAGMLVFNTATINDVQPGLYISDGTRWISMVVATNPVGTVITKASNVVPSGYLYCNGQAVSRTTYAALFADIGTTYGSGDGSTTFNLPDFRGQFLRGLDDGANIDSQPTRTIGSSQMDATQRLQGSFSDAFQAFTAAYLTQSGPFTAKDWVPRNPQPIGGGGYGGFNFDNSLCIRTATEERVRNIAVKFYIKY